MPLRVGDGVAANRLPAKPHHAVDLLPERVVAEHADRAGRRLRDVVQRRDADLAHRRAARTARRRAQRRREHVRRLQHDAGIPPCDRQRVRLLIRRQSEIPLEHAERPRAGAAPCVDRLERIAHGVHRATVRAVVRCRMEQRRDQRRLGGGGVLVFVEQHMAEPPAVPSADRGEPCHQLVRRHREVAEFRHVQAPFLRRVIGDEVEKKLTPFGRRYQLSAVGHAVLMEFGELGPQSVDTLPPCLLRHAVLVFRDLDVVELVRHRFVADRPPHPFDEGAVPAPDPFDRIVDADAVAADHRAVDGVGQLQQARCQGRQTTNLVIVHAEVFAQMTVYDVVGQLHRTGRAQRLRVLVESHQQTVLPHDGLEERIVGVDGRFKEHAIVVAMLPVAEHRRRHAFRQFAGGLAREGQAEDAFGGDVLPDQFDDASRHRVGLARSGARHDQKVVVDRRMDDLGLLVAVDDGVHDCLVSITVSIFPEHAGHTVAMRQCALCCAVGWATSRADLLAAAA